MERLYPTSVSAQKKGGLRGAFLGLCEAGLVKAIPAGNYTSSKYNKGYAVQAVELLNDDTQRWSVNELWREVSADTEKAHNSQMEDAAKKAYKQALDKNLPSPITRLLTSQYAHIASSHALAPQRPPHRRV
jgi:hypothetical protein